MAKISEIQKSFFKLITSSNKLDEQDKFHFKDGKISSEESIDIYRNNFLGGCLKVLELKYPVCQKLVGEKFFKIMSAEYSIKNTPQTTNLSDYGQSFPDFIKSFEPAKNLEYLADIAEVELLLDLSAKAKNESFFDDHTFIKMDEEKQERTILILNESVFLKKSNFPLKDIYDFTLNESKGNFDIADGKDENYFLIYKNNKKSEIRELQYQEFLFLKKTQESYKLIDIFEELEEEFEENLFSDYLAKYIQNGIIRDFVIK